jgi:hypothetical protein
MSDDDNNRRKESASDDAGGKGASSTKLITPNPIRSDVAGQTQPSATDHVDTTVTSGSGNKRKCDVLATKRKPSKTLADQVTTQIGSLHTTDPDIPQIICCKNYFWASL